VERQTEGNIQIEQFELQVANEGEYDAYLLGEHES
jgi:hypothetical protein